MTAKGKEKSKLAAIAALVAALGGVGGWNVHLVAQPNSTQLMEHRLSQTERRLDAIEQVNRDLYRILGDMKADNSQRHEEIMVALAKLETRRMGPIQ